MRMSPRDRPLLLQDQQGQLPGLFKAMGRAAVEEVMHHAAMAVQYGDEVGLFAVRGLQYPFDDIIMLHDHFPHGRSLERGLEERTMIGPFAHRPAGGHVGHDDLRPGMRGQCRKHVQGRTVDRQAVIRKRIFRIVRSFVPMGSSSTGTDDERSRLAA